MSPPRTVAEAYGEEAADALARWAIDTLVYPPAKIATFTTTIPAHYVRAGRDICERAGIQWRTLKTRSTSEGSP